MKKPARKIIQRLRGRGSERDKYEMNGKLKLVGFFLLMFLLSGTSFAASIADSFFSFHSKHGDQMINEDNSPVKSKVVIAGHRDIIYEPAWSPDGKFVAVGGGGLSVSVWNSTTHQLLRTLLLKGNGSENGSVAFSPDGRYLAAGLKVISIWDAKTGEWIRDIVGPFVDATRPQPRGIRSLAFSPDSKNLIAAYIGASERGGMVDTSVALYRVDTGKTLYAFEPRGLLGTQVFFTADGKYLVDGRYEIFREPDSEGRPIGNIEYKTYVDIWDAHTGKPVRNITPVHVMSPTALALSSDNKLIATATSTGTKESDRNVITNKWQNIDNEDPIRIWDFATGRLVKELDGVKSTVMSMSFNPNGRYLVSCQWDKKDKTIWVWDVASGSIVDRVETSKYAGPPMGCMFSPDGSRLATVNGEELIFIEFKN
jgi:WD40 repeat protein